MKRLKTDVSFLPRRNGLDHLCFVPGIPFVAADPRVRCAWLLLDWEGEAPASTGPLPHGPSVYHSAQKCMSPENQPIGQGFVAALTKASSEEWLKAMSLA